MPDLMDAFQEAQLRQQEQINEAARLPDRIAHALPPDFRDCSACDEPIGSARLQALPTTQLCRDCAQRAEQYSRRFASR